MRCRGDTSLCGSLATTPGRRRAGAGFRRARRLQREAQMLDFPLLPSVGRPHRNLSPWIGGGLLAAGGLAAIVAIALTPIRRAPGEVAPGAPPVVTAVAPFAAPCEIPDAGENHLPRWTI